MIKIRVLFFICVITLFSFPSSAMIDRGDIENAVIEFQTEMKQILQDEDFNLFAADARVKCEGKKIKLAEVAPEKLIEIAHSNNKDLPILLAYAPDFLFRICDLLRLGTFDDWTDDRRSRENFTRWEAVGPMSDAAKSVISTFSQTKYIKKFAEMSKFDRYFSEPDNQGKTFSDFINPQIVTSIKKLSATIYPLFLENGEAALRNLQETNIWFHRVICDFGSIVLYTLRDPSIRTLSNDDIGRLKSNCYRRNSEFNYNYCCNEFGKKLTEADFVKEVANLAKEYRKSFTTRYPEYLNDSELKLDQKNRRLHTNLNGQKTSPDQASWLCLAFMNFLQLETPSAKNISFDKYLFLSQDFQKIFNFHMQVGTLNFLNREQFEPKHYGNKWGSNFAKHEFTSSYDPAPESYMINLLNNLSEGGHVGFKLDEIRGSRNLATRRAYFYLNLCCNLLAAKNIKSLVAEYRDIFDADINTWINYINPAPVPVSYATSSTSATNSTMCDMDALQTRVAPTPPADDLNRANDKRPVAVEVYKFLDEAKNSYTKLAELFGNLQFKVPNLSVEELELLKTQMEHAKHLQMALENTARNIQKLANKK